MLLALDRPRVPGLIERDRFRLGHSFLPMAIKFSPGVPDAQPRLTYLQRVER